MPNVVRHLPLLLLAVLAATAFAISGMTYGAPEGGFSGPDEIAAATNFTKPSATPHWKASYAAPFPGCVEQLTKGTTPSDVLAVRLDGSLHRVDFTEAWHRTHDASHADDIWIVGACA